MGFLAEGQTGADGLGPLRVVLRPRLDHFNLEYMISGQHPTWDWKLFTSRYEAGAILLTSQPGLRNCFSAPCCLSAACRQERHLSCPTSDS